MTDCRNPVRAAMIRPCSPLSWRLARAYPRDAPESPIPGHRARRRRVAAPFLARRPRHPLLGQPPGHTGQPELRRAVHPIRGNDVPLLLAPVPRNVPADLPGEPQRLGHGRALAATRSSQCRLRRTRCGPRDAYASHGGTEQGRAALRSAATSPEPRSRVRSRTGACACMASTAATTSAGMPSTLAGRLRGGQEPAGAHTSPWSLA